jgi:hypothetical protein
MALLAGRSKSTNELAQLYHKSLVPHIAPPPGQNPLLDIAPKEIRRALKKEGV